MNPPEAALPAETAETTKSPVATVTSLMICVPLVCAVVSVSLGPVWSTPAYCAHEALISREPAVPENVIETWLLPFDGRSASLRIATIALLAKPVPCCAFAEIVQV